MEKHERVCNFDCNKCSNWDPEEQKELCCKNADIKSVDDFARYQVVEYCTNYKEQPSIRELLKDVENKDARKLHQYEVIDDDPEHLEKIKNTFEIIKKKKVNVGLLYDYISRDEGLRLGALGTYNLLIDQSLQLTDEEFNLLKEMLLESRLKKCY